MSRKIAREELFKLLFEAELNGVLPTEILDGYLTREEVELDENSKKFIADYARGIVRNIQGVEEALTTNMTNWSLGRVGNVERALLKFGAYELMYEEVGHEIVINEIVELAKKYGDEKSYEFINGVLAKLVK